MSRMTKLVLALVFSLSAFTAGQTEEQEDADITGLLKMFESISVGFYLDSTYQYSFNEPDSGEIGARSLYPDDNEFKFNAFTLSFEKTPSANGSLIDHLGFRTDILFGDQADLLNPSGIDSDAVSPYQAYIQVMPVEGLNVYFGQFVTLAGFEVIEAKDNPNISRSILFGYAIPFTHTGIRATYETGPLSVALGVNNGWDQWDDDNDAKTIEAQIGLAGSNDTVEGSLYVTGYFGKENDDFGNDEWRELITVVGSLAFGPLTLYADLDFGWQQDVELSEDFFDDVFWWGIAGYAVLDAHPMVTLALRGEYFDDDDGFRGFGTTVWEITPTIIFKPFKGMPNSELTEYLDNFEFRVEYRFDKADEPIFEDEGVADDTQHTIMAQALYWINL
ncbi:MAG: outer membrane beta-barrel protein [Candidatus Dadabacteria bacterium]|nr:outer membrane beta-barrel protein [Candidatus Dadabacteria bacterium]